MAHVLMLIIICAVLPRRPSSAAKTVLAADEGLRGRNVPSMLCVCVGGFTIHLTLTSIAKAMT